MKSVTVNVNVVTYIDLDIQPAYDEYEKSVNMTFIDLIMDPNVDYVNIDKLIKSRHKLGDINIRISGNHRIFLAL
jgi:hypothetical protein